MLRKGGFALIVAITMLALLTAMALAVLAMSRGTARRAEPESHLSIARANARLALNLALNQLQTELGPDQRISCRAAILDSSPETPEVDGVQNPEWLGVWNANQTDSSSNQAGRPDEFRRWLVSMPGQLNYGDAKSSSLGGVETFDFRLPGDGTTIARAGMVPINGSGGSYAWHISDNAQLARSDLAARDEQDIANFIANRGALARHAPETLEGFEDMATSQESLAKHISDRSISIGGSNTGQRSSSLQALTTKSASLLTNVAAGGFKKDINTLMELTDIGGFEDLGYGKWEGDGAYQSRDAYLYAPGIATGARWNLLHAYYNLYKDITFDNGVPELQPPNELINWVELADKYRDFGDEAGGFRFPRMAKIHYVFSYETVRSPINPSRYRLNLVTDVFFTLWNPFNVRIVFPEDACMFIKFSEGLPMKFDWFVNGVNLGDSNLHEMVTSEFSLFIQQNVYNQSDKGLFVMEPGETLVFSSDGTRYTPGIQSFDEGVRARALVNGRPIEGGGGDRIGVSLIADENAGGYTLHDGTQSSQYCDYWIIDSSRSIPFYEHRGEIATQPDAPFLQTLQPVDQSDIRSVTFGQALGRKQPFGLFSVELKSSRESNNPAMPFLHSGYTRLSSKVGNITGEINTERMEYRLDPITSFNSDLLQLSTDAHPAGPNHGFIGTGRTFGTGVTHMLHQGATLVPMTSIAEFQHAGTGDGAAVLRATNWDFNSTPNPPYMSFAVGNSYAHPLIPKNRNRNRAYYDHSYWSNQLLWEDFFCSSLTPQTKEIFGSPRSIGEVWSDFLEGTDPLLNPRYRPYLSDVSADEAESDIIDGNEPTPEAHQRIGARLLYEGGFNVNSTSVAAWKAFLSGGDQTRLQIIEALNRNPSGQNSAASGSPFSRTKVPLGESIDAAPANRQLQYLGYRDLSDEQMTDLAQAVVKQVKLRGPFLNMSEFINRQLSSNTALAVSGALQSAIDDTSINDPIAAQGVQTSGTGKGFAFPEAAEGNSARGGPGWLMQADLLTPLGPSIFVRGDTFTIRAYGDARNAQGEILSRATCEAVVQRTPSYVDSSENTLQNPPRRPVNLALGRRFEILEFRWVKNEA